jgi:putative ATP-binding cassette transporter
MIIVFLAIVCYTYLLNIIFQKGLNKYAFKLLYDNEKKLFTQILKAPLVALEKFGSQRFYTVMEDLRLFSSLPYTITHTVTSILMLVLGIVYMFTLSSKAAFIVLLLILLVAACYFIVMNTMTKQVGELRMLNEHYYKYVNDLIGGFKELKLSQIRRNNILGNYLIPNRNQSEKLDFKVNFVFLSINLISQYGLYFVIAIILFGLPALGLLTKTDVIAYVVVILFISGPINNLINLQQTYTRFMVANRRIKNFMKDFEIEEKTKNIDSPTYLSFQSLTFNNVLFKYSKDNETTSPFVLGPIDLEIQKGEVVFVVGGNGSGKSTFINVLTGLYKPIEGEIKLNGKSTENFQNEIAAVFTNNHIFSQNYDQYVLEGNENYKSLLQLMEMDTIISDDKEESARRKFSKGQSKRMSLIFALLEEKPILVLDEWAADQDPHFRKYFYEVLISKIKKEGKTIIAVTHDDTYFHLADRIIKFDYGTIVKDLKTSNTTQLSQNLWL